MDLPRGFENIYGEWEGELRPVPVTRLDASIHDQPHYTEDLFRHAQVIFGERGMGKHCAYSDRLMQWDYEAHKRAWEYANENCRRSTGRWYQEYLRAYYNNEGIEVTCIMSGHNLSNGYPYQFIEWKGGI